MSNNFYVASKPLIRIGGNRFDISNSPPWDFPLETAPLRQNNSSPPLTESIIIGNCSSVKMVRKKGEKLGPGEIAIVAGGGGLVILFAALFVALCKTQICAKQRSKKHMNTSLPVSIAEGEPSPQSSYVSSHILFTVVFFFGRSIIRCKKMT